jgi:hypothetical protein
VATQRKSNGCWKSRSATSPSDEGFDRIVDWHGTAQLVRAQLAKHCRHPELNIGQHPTNRNLLQENCSPDTALRIGRGLPAIVARVINCFVAREIAIMEQRCSNFVGALWVQPLEGTIGPKGAVIARGFHLHLSLFRHSLNRQEGPETPFKLHQSNPSTDGTIVLPQSTQT